MKLLLYILLLLPGDTCRENYLKEILHNSNGVDYFLVVKAKPQGEKITCIVLSRIELSDNLKKESRSIDDKIISKIKDGQFILPVDDSSKWFTEVNRFADVDDAKAKGEKYFIEKYFDKGGYLKSDVPFKYVGHIVQVLFDWNVLVSEAEGNLYVNRKQFCK